MATEGKYKVQQKKEFYCDILGQAFLQLAQRKCVINSASLNLSLHLQCLLKLQKQVNTNENVPVDHEYLQLLVNSKHTSSRATEIEV